MDRVDDVVVIAREDETWWTTDEKWKDIIPPNSVFFFDGNKLMIFDMETGSLRVKNKTKSNNCVKANK